MSAYVYQLLSKTVTIKINGQEHEAGVLKYAYKPLWSMWDKEPKWQILAKARIARLEKLWRARGYTPKYVVTINEKVEPGCGVLDWHSNGNKMAVSTYDDPDWGGRMCLGELDNDFNLVQT